MKRKVSGYDAKRPPPRTAEPPLPHIYDEYAERLLCGTEGFRRSNASYVARRHGPLSRRAMEGLWRLAVSHYVKRRQASKDIQYYIGPYKKLQVRLTRLARRVYGFCQDRGLIWGSDLVGCLKEMRARLYVPDSIADHVLAKVVKALNSREFKRLSSSTGGALLLQYRALPKRRKFLEEFTDLLNTP